MLASGEPGAIYVMMCAKAKTRQLLCCFSGVLRTSISQVC